MQTQNCIVQTSRQAELLQLAWQELRFEEQLRVSTRVHLRPPQPARAIEVRMTNTRTKM